MKQSETKIQLGEFPLSCQKPTVPLSWWPVVHTHTHIHVQFLFELTIFNCYFWIISNSFQENGSSIPVVERLFSDYDQVMRPGLGGKADSLISYLVHVHIVLLPLYWFIATIWSCWRQTIQSLRRTSSLWSSEIDYAKKNEREYYKFCYKTSKKAKKKKCRDICAKKYRFESYLYTETRSV